MMREARRAISSHLIGRVLTEGNPFDLLFIECLKRWELFFKSAPIFEFLHKVLIFKMFAAKNAPSQWTMDPISPTIN
jgi:hypothetical protein